VSVTGIVLAAGLGTRMGETKQLVDLGGSPMIAVSVATAIASGLDRVITVVGHDAEAVAAAVPAGAEVVVNSQYARGNLTSFRCGVEAAGDVAVMLLVGDMPGMTTSIIDTCLDSYERHQPWALMARYRDVAGHPYVFSPSAVAMSHEYEGRKALYRMLREQTAGKVLEVAFDRDRPRDVNTADDVADYLGGVQ
jgi:CTP:molybdopterin cytidylyltransferase MocA